MEIKMNFNKRWKRIEAQLLPYLENPEPTLRYIRELYSVYDSGCLGWLGGLFDSQLGGFYYSNSARDGDEFFPDIESTGQGIAILNVSGAIKTYEEIPEWIRSGIAGFICSCEDPGNGYFYNPQWSKDSADSNPIRRARDFGWAIDLAEKLDFDMPYFAIFSNVQNKDKILPKYLESKEKFAKYLESKNWKEKIYESIDELINQYDPIFYAGYGEYALDFLDSIRDKDSGLWGEGYVGKETQLRCACAALNLYSALNRPLSNPMKLFELALSSFSDGGSALITAFSNRFTTIRLIMNLLEYSTDNTADKTVREIKERFSAELPSIITMTVNELNRFQKPDGSFSYFEHFSSSHSYAMPVAQENAREGDINATLHALGVWNAVIYIITGGRIRIPLFTPEDMQDFERAANSRRVISSL